MKTLYLDCSMGAAGDMLTGALLELVPHPHEMLEQINALGIPGVETRATQVQRCGIVGTQVSVLIDGVQEAEGMHAHGDAHTHDHVHTYDHVHTHDHAHDHEHLHDHEYRHAHRGLADIERTLASLNLPQAVCQNALAVYRIIAEAESQVHGAPLDQIHFHEVGTLDALADVVAVCLLMHNLSPDRVVASPVHVGAGTVECAHGVLPVPAPATALILKGVPIYGGEIHSELCTPTGAALLKAFVDEFGELPPMTLLKTGYGMGKKEFDQANCVRALWGETASRGAATEEAVELACNIDDMTAEEIGFVQDLLREAGALEVYTTAAAMKKSRPGVVLNVLCSLQDTATMRKLLFKHTTTIGLRERKVNRFVLDRYEEIVETPYGGIRKKLSRGFGVQREKLEYEDLARIAREHNMSLFELKDSLGQM